MVRQIYTISVGGAGIRSGFTIWKQYFLEHDIDFDGSRLDKNQDMSLQSMFDETMEGRFVPRCLMVDLEPEAIDNIKVSKYGKLFHPEFMLSGKDGADGCFARGHYTIGKEIMDKVNDRLRKKERFADGGQGFIINHSVGGGTGSGLGTLI